MPSFTLQSPILYEYVPRALTVSVVSVSPDIVIAGDVRSFFKIDSMYLYTPASGGVWAVRVNGSTFDGVNTTLFFPQFAYSRPSSTGSVVLTECYHEVTKIYGRTLCTIGDSLTWNAWGSYFRGLLRDNGLEYDFAGSHTDTFNFRHEGEGGNTTNDVLNRLNKIADSTHYLILLGTNDINLTPQQTVNNLLLICDKLSQRKPCKIYLSTLLPRQDTEFNKFRVNSINIMLRAKQLNENIKLIDLNAELSMYESTWNTYTLSDLLHPNLSGYNLICSKLAPMLEF